MLILRVSAGQKAAGATIGRPAVSTYPPVSCRSHFLRCRRQTARTGGVTLREAVVAPLSSSVATEPKNEQTLCREVVQLAAARRGVSIAALSEPPISSSGAGLPWTARPVPNVGRHLRESNTLALRAFRIRWARERNSPTSSVRWSAS